jgi:F-type H+-transporting ATPase subunit alpha
VSVPAQITVLLALTANLFDPVPLEKMTAAAHAVQESATTIPAEVSARFETAAKLSDGDKKTIVEIARKALVSFQAKPEVKVEPKTKDEAKIKTEPKPKPEAKVEPKTEVKSETKPKVESKPESQAELKSTAKVELKEKT